MEFLSPPLFVENQAVLVVSCGHYVLVVIDEVRKLLQRSRIRNDLKHPRREEGQLKPRLAIKMRVPDQKMVSRPIKVQPPGHDSIKKSLACKQGFKTKKMFFF